jgi:hypothetical protein
VRDASGFAYSESPPFGGFSALRRDACFSGERIIGRQDWLDSAVCTYKGLRPPSATSLDRKPSLILGLAVGVAKKVWTAIDRTDAIPPNIAE